MKKIALVCGLLSFGALAHAADPLHGTQWRTIDEKTNQPKAIVKFTEQSNGSLKATIQQILTKGEENACTKCEGPYQNKSLKGLTVINGLKSTGATTYDGGTILDPKDGKTYKSKAELSKDGKTLKVRGYMGVSALGRNQTWYRVN